MPECRHDALMLHGFGVTIDEDCSLLLPAPMYEDPPTIVIPTTVTKIPIHLKPGSGRPRKNTVNSPANTIRDPRSIWNTEAVVNRRPMPERVVPPRSQHAGSKHTNTSPQDLPCRVHVTFPDARQSIHGQRGPPTVNPSLSSGLQTVLMKCNLLFTPQDAYSGC